MNNISNNNMEKWAVNALCQKTMSSISYAFNITWLNIIIVKEHLSGFYKLIMFMSAFQNVPLNP